MCLPRKKSPWEERRDTAPENWSGAVLWKQGKNQTQVFYSSSFYVCILGWIVLGATKALEDDLHPLLFQQLIRGYLSLVPPPALAVTSFIRNLILPGFPLRIRFMAPQ